MEVDAMHSCIEKAKSHMKIFLPKEWYNVIRVARRANAYKVIEVDHNSFLNFKAVGLEMGKKDVHDNPVQYSKITQMKLRQERPAYVYLKYNFDGDYTKVRTGTVDLPQKLYASKLPISVLKKKDLVKLCNQGVIPRIYQKFYLSLPSSKSVRLVLAEPDIEEFSEDSD